MIETFTTLRRKIVSVPKGEQQHETQLRRSFVRVWLLHAVQGARNL